MAQCDKQAAKAQEEHIKLSGEVVKTKQECGRLIQELASATHTSSTLQKQMEEQERRSSDLASSEGSLQDANDSA